MYSLNIVNDVIDTDLPKDEYYHYYQLVHDKHSDKIIEGLHIAFVELPKFKPQNEKETKMRDLWLRFLTEINGATKTVPPELIENPLTNKAVTLMEEAGMTEGERYAYYKNIDNVWVEQAIMRTCKAKGLAEGRAEGIAEGRAEGEKIGMEKGKEIGLAEGKTKANLETARKLLDLGIDIETIGKATGLSKEKIADLV